MADLKITRPATEAERTTRTTLDTIEVTPDLLKSWKSPPFQRPLKVNDKVIALSQEIKQTDGVIPGVMTLGVLEKQRYLIDGQHRREAFILSGCIVGYVDVRITHYGSMAEMGDEFVKLNSRLVVLRPDDILRGLEGSVSSLGRLRRRCPFIGYDMVRRGERSPLVSMSAVLRCWFGSAPETPAPGGLSTTQVTQALTEDEAATLIDFMELAYSAWGKDPEYHRLWLNLNLTMCMWLYRRLVITPYSPKTPKLTREQFRECLMALSAAPGYLQWLLGRQMRQSDRSPAYNRVKSVFAARIETALGKKPSLPSPVWAPSK